MSVVSAARAVAHEQKSKSPGHNQPLGSRTMKFIHGASPLCRDRPMCLSWVNENLVVFQQSPFFPALLTTIKFRAKFFGKNFPCNFIELERFSTKEMEGRLFDETEKCLMCC